MKKNFNKAVQKESIYEQALDPAYIESVAEKIRDGFPHHASGLCALAAAQRDAMVALPSEHMKPELAVVALLEMMGENPEREGLRDTPQRVVKAWRELTAGYAQDPAAILARDFDGGDYDEMIVCPNIEFHSTCEHHLLPFHGLAHVAYVPRKRVVGLSKMPRLVDCFARRLQIQEHITKQISDAMMLHLKPRGVAVIVQARHMCMSCRGVGKQQASMITSSMTGVFQKGIARAELFKLIGLAKQ